MSSVCVVSPQETLHHSAGGVQPYSVMEIVPVSVTYNIVSCNHVSFTSKRCVILFQQNSYVICKKTATSSCIRRDCTSWRVWSTKSAHAVDQADRPTNSSHQFSCTTGLSTRHVFAMFASVRSVATATERDLVPPLAEQTAPDLAQGWRGLLAGRPGCRVGDPTYKINHQCSPLSHTTTSSCASLCKVPP